MATFRQRGKKKTWDYRIYDSKGKLIASNSGFRTKKEAQLEASEKERAISQGYYFKSRLSLYDLWLRWYQLTIESSDRLDSTKNKYLRRASVLKKEFSDKNVSDIKHSEYQEFINTYGERVTKNTLSRLNADIRKAIKLAQRDGLFLNDFTDGVILNAQKKSKKIEDKYIDNSTDYHRLLVLIRQDLNYKKNVTSFFLYILFKTGLRVAECMAMIWEDIDFENGFIRTYRRYDKINERFTEAKTDDSIREVPINQQIISVLKLLYREQKAYLDSRGLSNKEGFVFYSRLQEIPTHNAINKRLKHYLEELSLNENMTAYGARHTYASYLLAKGVDIWVVAKILGHKNIEQLTKTYGHLFQEKYESEIKEVRLLLTDKVS